MTTNSDILARAWTACQSGDMAAAARLYRRALQDNADDPDAWCMLGIVCRALGDLDQAVHAYREALRLRPDFAAVQHNLGNVLQAQGKLDEAIATYRQVLRLRPGSAETYTNLAEALTRQGKRAEAASCFCQAIDCKPDHPVAYRQLAALLGSLEDREQVIADLERRRADPPEAAGAEDRPSLRKIYDFHCWFSQGYQRLLGLRYTTFYHALMLARVREARNIVETGTTRQPGNWYGDGQSTCLFGAFAQRYGGKVWTCDISAANIEAARTVTAEFRSHIEYVVADSVEFLTGFAAPIDLLYLDSFDFDPVGDPNPPQDHALREGQAALHALHDRSIVLVDDCGIIHGGKGGKVIPFLLGQGWQAIERNYQVLLTRERPGR